MSTVFKVITLKRRDQPIDCGGEKPSFSTMLLGGSGSSGTVSSLTEEKTLFILSKLKIEKCHTPTATSRVCSVVPLLLYPH